MTELRTLVLEDSATDAELAVFELERAGLRIIPERVSTRSAFITALEEFKPDVVLADYSLPNFNGSEALQWVSEHHPHIPVIIVTGALGDELAIELIKTGARDYVLKSNLVRLAQAVLRALAEVGQIQAREQAERALAASELRYRRLFEAARDSIIITDASSGVVLDVNPFLEVLLGYPRSEYLGKKLWEAGPFDGIVAIKDVFTAVQQLEYMRCEDMQLQTRAGAGVEIEGTSTVCVVDMLRVIQWNFRDVTEIRRAAEAAAIEREKLLASLELRVEERTAQLRAMAFELTNAEERERQAIARDLHDSLGQTLAIAKIKLNSLPAETDRPEVAKTLAAVLKLIDQSNQSVRSLAAQLSPPVLYDLGLMPALEWLAEQKMRDFGLRCRIVADPLPKALDQSVCAIMFRAVQELLINIVKHADVATAPVDISVSVLGTVPDAADQLRIVVKDTGRGFDPQSVKSTTEGGFGLMSVRERLTYIGGSLDIVSKPGRGTAVMLTAPLRLSDR